MKNKTLIIYGGNSKIIQSCINFFLDTFDNIIMISRKYSGISHDNIKIINYEEQDMLNNLDKYLEGEIIFISAAIFSSNELFINEDETSISKSVAVNILNNIRILQYLIKRSLDIKKGKFIYLSSFRVDSPTVGTSMYSSSKAYIEKLFDALAVEYSRFNLKFNIIKIGLSQYGLSNNLKYDIRSKKFLMNNISSARLMNNKDLESTFSYLFDNDYINGTSIDLTGKIKLDLKT